MTFWLILYLTITSITWVPVLSTKTAIRLLGGRTEYEGRLEIYDARSETWGTVCDQGWDDNDAHVVCRQLGLTGGKARTQAFFGKGAGEILVSGVRCAGTERYIMECAHNGWGVHVCTHRNDAGVMCDKDIRLMGGYTKNEGRLEVYDIVSDIWGTVCGAWDNNASRVVCRQLGMAGGVVLDQAMFSPGSRSILLSDIVCEGVEETIDECGHSSFSNPTCRHVDDVGVRCDPGVRLVDGPTAYEGRLEVFDVISRTWGTVCDDGWDDNAAHVVCRYLGMTGDTAVINGFYGPGHGPIHLSNAVCDGTEATPMDCIHDGVGRNTCIHAEDAGVRCNAPSESEGNAICYIYRDGSVKTFSGKVIPNALTNGKNYVASLGPKDAPNENNCKFAMMAFYDHKQKSMTWASFSYGVHSKKSKKYYRNFAFERRGATRKIEERGYLKRQTRPLSYITSFPHKMRNLDNTLNVTVSKLLPKKGWQLTGGTCPYSVVYRFKKTHPAVMFKLRWGQYYRLSAISGICGE